MLESQTGKFSIFKAGKPFGTETYEVIRGDDGVVSAGDVTLNIPGGFSQRVTLRTDTTGQPVEFRVDRIAGEKPAKLEVTFAGGKASLRSEADGQHRTQEIDFAAGGVVLWGNVFHHFLFLIERYDFHKGGLQTFHLFPSKTALIEAKESREITLEGRSHSLEHLFVDIEGIFGIDLFRLDGGLIKIAVPLQRIEAVLEGVPGLDRTTELHVAPRPHNESAATNAPQIHAEDVRFPSSDGVYLAGTLTWPENATPPFPGVVLVSGSGPQDRNEDTIGSGGIHYGIFRIIAQWLSAAGIAVLRYDDRGVAESGGVFESAGLFDLAEDARSAIRFVSSHPLLDARRLGIVGHSEGGLIAALVAAKDPSIRAIALMGTLAHSLDHILLRQFERFASALRTDKARDEAVERREKSLATLKQTGDWESPDVEDEFRNNVPKIQRKWFEEHFAINPELVLQQVKCPVAILHGALDVQVDPANADRLREALEQAGHTDHLVMILPHLDHLFIPSSGRGLSEYADRSRTLDEGFLESLVQWLSVRLARTDGNL